MTRDRLCRAGGSGKTQSSMMKSSFGPPCDPHGPAFERPNPAIPLNTGRREISFSASAERPGSNYPNAELWIDSRHVDWRLDIRSNLPHHERIDLQKVPWIGAARASSRPTRDGGRRERRWRHLRQRVGSDRPLAPDGAVRRAYDVVRLAAGGSLLVSSTTSTNRIAQVPVWHRRLQRRRSGRVTRPSRSSL